MNCPNDKSIMIESDTHYNCTKCMYSMSKSVKKQVKKDNFLDKRLKTSLEKSVSLIEMELLEKGMMDHVFVPWKNKRWILCPKRNYKTLRPYNGWNKVLLYWEKSDLFLTAKNIEDLNLQVPIDDKAVYVIGWFPVKKKKNETESEFKFRTRFRKFYSVVHTIYRQTDIEGLPEKILPEDRDNKRDENAEQFIQRLVEKKGLKISEGGNEAYFRNSDDEIIIPKISRFANKELYYASLFHEIIHWTGQEKRLNRFKDDTEKDTAYGREELVAEMGAAALCHMHEIDVLADQASYIETWLNNIKKDYSILLEATGRAEKALSFLA